MGALAVFIQPIWVLIIFHLKAAVVIKILQKKVTLNMYKDFVTYQCIQALFLLMKLKIMIC